MYCRVTCKCVCWGSQRWCRFGGFSDARQKDDNVLGRGHGIAGDQMRDGMGEVQFDAFGAFQPRPWKKSIFPQITVLQTG